MTPSITLRGISSMATRLVLQELTEAYTLQTGIGVQIESIGGVDVAKRVANAEPFDVVFLGSGAMDKLLQAGHLLANSVVPLMNSATAVAVASGSAHPDISTEAALQAAVLAAPSISYSTGPSGVALAALFERWSLAQTLADRTITPPPGTPVGSLVAQGEAALGFQQLSELIHVEGIDVVGPLPEPLAIQTIFSGGVASTSQQAQAAHDLLAFLASDQTSAAKRAQGMDPV